MAGLLNYPSVGTLVSSPLPFTQPFPAIGLVTRAFLYLGYYRSRHSVTLDFGALVRVWHTLPATSAVRLISCSSLCVATSPRFLELESGIKTAKSGCQHALLCLDFGRVWLLFAPKLCAIWKVPG